MQKTKAVFSSNSFWLVLIIVVLTLMSISLWLDFIKANKSIPPENPNPLFAGRWASHIS